MLFFTDDDDDCDDDDKHCPHGTGTFMRLLKQFVILIVRIDFSQYGAFFEELN